MRIHFAAVLCGFFSTASTAETWQEVWEGLSSSFALPINAWMEENRQLSIAELLTKPWDISPGLSWSKNSPLINANVTYKPISYWFAEADFFYYLGNAEQQPWDPGFVYRFGYDDWHPYTLSLIYGNYTGNRGYQDLFSNYDEGTYILGWNFPIPTPLARPFLIETDTSISCKLNYHFSPRYRDTQGDLQRHKRRWSIFCNVPIYGNWRLNFNVFHYPHSHQQQPWDPDYTYEFAYKNEQEGGLIVAYKNYRGNRFPWRTDLPHDGGFDQGSLNISWAWKWQ